ncbi:assimilatory sulfite reductase (NADPH) flavoprotein subunit [Testudinibacter sp. TR-2022]|uniref:assimilatory sulfite reductase (NADPH) flavoprotein subunit n=1 Tax=Testudinibacter sp. TR-2022 TaxID=2585029 RepID=UPI00111908C3|nr:assimilatory sulfite reductase (NADPH) flavoprotein subunit [Testudinibacter sp. TR-2022]TNH02212.1 assimilatory sulfite reductase (NADPH) flavoprotein subunit [Pasteurellaceae bacterium Phil31]TNH08127.1 assimilatory sulfite reductase (NADPH) flavoprotein subunit [Testudinibacter sp. TR-2022]TNH10791.1 assimilatory sulfite reductase (NADPH) flavoprotein subunit [Testudinibacter sp. TR-2022]TNH16477.1 assimilatory sulfite reductase (NADPH) flavoprotein subunit [Testudinibacter sp. TR-2022]T
MTIEKITNLTLPPELSSSLATLDALQLAWLSGYCWSEAQNRQGGQSAVSQAAGALPTALQPSLQPLQVTIISASQTGNARKVAEQLKTKLVANGVEVKQVAAADYKPKNLADEKYLLLVTSTQGDGEPPEEAVSLHKYLFGKKAPNLSNTEFAVLGLGDSSYPDFCQAGKDFDAKLAELGGKRLLERQDCDLDYQAIADSWIEQINRLLQQINQNQTQNQAQTQTQIQNQSAVRSVYSKENPFSATLALRQKITARGSEKDVRHLEIDLSGSGLHYQPGDALGVWFNNDPALVEEILQAVSLHGEEKVRLNGDEVSIRTALLQSLEITQNTPHFVKGYADLVSKRELNEQLKTAAAIQDYIQTTPIIGVLQAYPLALSAEQLLGLLRPLTPRLYSIASAQDEVGDEVHLTVGLLQYAYADKTRFGAASSYLAQRLEEDGEVRVFIEQNDNFRLPPDNNTPIIMIGSGTGIAPFRAFVQQRAATEAQGKNWLIFGNQHFTDDFLYQIEWQTFAKEGYLHQYNFAWSRDQAEKIYVQHKIREQAESLWQWLQQGAHIYVCGDASRMAKDVEQALLEVIAEQGGLSIEDADEYLDQLRQNKRYQRDVY